MRRRVHRIRAAWRSAGDDAGYRARSIRIAQISTARRHRGLPIPRHGTKDMVPELGCHAVALGTATPVVDGVPSFALLEPVRSGAPVVSSMVAQRVPQIAGDDASGERRGSPPVREEDRGCKYQRDNGCGAQQGRRTDQSHWPIVVSGVPGSERLQAVKYESVHQVFDR